MLGDGIQWDLFDNSSSSQQDLPLIRLYDCNFPSDVHSIVFKLSGLMSLIRCEFKGRYGLDVILILDKSQDESEVTEETLRNFNSRDDQNRIEMIQTKIDVRYLQIYVNYNVVRGLKMENVDLGVNPVFDIYIGEKGQDCQAVSVFELYVINCRMLDVVSSIHLSLRLPNSFSKFRFENTVFKGIYFYNDQHAGTVSIIFDNCTFMKAMHIVIQRFIYFKISDSTINMPYDCQSEDCNVHLTGLDDYDETLLIEAFFEQNFGLVEIENSTFQGGYGPFLSVNQAYLKLSKTVFHIQCYRTRPEHLIHLQTKSIIIFTNPLSLGDVLINLTSVNRELQQVNIMSIVAFSVDFQNTQILCPLGMDAVQSAPLNPFEPNTVQCEAACTSDMYTFQSGNVNFNGHYAIGYTKSITHVSNHVKPLCSKCPVGAKCSGTIKALPNYWGYRTKDTVAMVRCPTAYCCQDDESCQTFDTCNSNRSGPLCGVCDKGFAESLFDQTCISVEKCHTWFIVLLYISCVVGYGLGLMVIDNVKEAVISSLKKIYQCIKGTVLKKVKPDQDSEKPKNSEKSKCPEKEVKEEGSFKYLQILFYYVQDAALFKIELPGKKSEQTSTFVKILQFTPDVLTSIYDSMTETCFTLGTTAVSKILFKSIFGPCVMLFLFILYLCQSCVFSVRQKTSKVSSVIKYKLVQSFLLVILFSYQQIITGAFTLVKCIDIENINRLYVQGNIQCFTHWQTAIEIFIWANIFPSFFVFSHVPYYVEMNQMSVEMFILVCLIPVPCLMIFHLSKAWNKIRRNFYVQNNKERDLELNQREVTQEEISLMVTGIGSNLSLNSIVCTDTLELSYVISDSDTDIANEYSTDIMTHFKTDSKEGTLAEEEIKTDLCSKHSSEHNSKDQKVIDSKEAITEILLKNYK